MIPGIELTDLIRLVGLLGVAAIVFAESGLLIGFFLPGDSLLFTAGFLIQQGAFGDLSIHLAVLVLFFAAVAGDSVGYLFGKRVGRRLFRREKSLLFNPTNIAHAEAFYEKHGAKTILLARFIPVVRTFAPIVAGVSRMPYKTFLTFNLIGGALWAAGITYLGYFAGGWFQRMGIDIDHYLLPIIAGIVLLSLVPPVAHVLSDKNQRAAIMRKLRTIGR